MIKTQGSEQKSQKPKRQRVNLFKKFETTPKVIYKKVPLHFQFTNQPIFELDHSTKPKYRSNFSRTNSTMSYFKRPESRSKIFDKRSKSMRSGTFSVNDASEQRDTITTEQRTRKSRIYPNQTPVSIREDNRSLQVHQNMRELISFNNTQKVQLKDKAQTSISFTYQSPQKVSKRVHHDRTPPKIRAFNEPMNPLDLYALVKKKPCYLSSKKKQKRQNYMTFHVSGFNTISPIVFDESLQSSVRPKNVYRI